MSINNITFLDQFISNNLFIFNNCLKQRFYFNDWIEVSMFLAELESDQVYVLSFDFVYSWLMYDEGDPIITLSKPILITKNSDPKIISDFIRERITLAIDSYNLDDTRLESHSNGDQPGVILNYDKINIF